MDHHQDLEQIIRSGPVRRQAHPELAGTIDRALRTGRLVSVLPGIYLPPDRAKDSDLLLRAAMLWAPAAVLTGRWAAARQFWPELATGPIELAMPTHRSARTRPFRLVRRRVPAELVGRWSGIRCSRPALTAMDLCPELGPEVIDRVLRSRKVTPPQLRRALELSPQRAGNLARKTQLLDAAGNPWSYAERLTHRVLRDAGIVGWRANPKLLVRGHVYYPDILFDEVKLVVEIDGLHHARDVEVFQSDLWRMNDFILERYTMLRYTLADVQQRPRMLTGEVLEMRSALAREKRARDRQGR